MQFHIAIREYKYPECSFTVIAIYLNGVSMSLSITDHINLDVIIASLSGALVYILTQHHFDKGRQPFIFIVSFVMGIVGADTALMLVNNFIPSDFTGKRPVGAFLCSALAVTVMIKIIAYIENKVIIKKKD
ncbi:hypothetical protein CD006_26360 [Enterobacter sp. 10-1]|uniref:putative holin n=1 Tax=Raoultella sp. 10-1 TaxID=2683201 RepID=UPI000BA4D207|nr:MULTISPECIES: putative holin [Enterobacteriaceae]MVT06067.1 hypothetical protein [Raoultella sp. 10-1]PAC07327.1 hypothetical protein CD006_26360 [Enterobacter sp. 10-1]